MKVSYRGVQNALPPKLQEKLDAKFAKLSKLLERRGEKEAHVVVTTERHLHKTEVTVPFYDHEFVGLGADADLFTSMSQALDKLEKQAVKTRDKWREKRRDSTDVVAKEPSVKPVVKPVAKGNGKLNAKPSVKPNAKTNGRVDARVFSVNHHDRRKPMTLEEAIIELDSDSSLSYMVYRDADKECVSVLVRRQDGHFDLIES
jgi:putative sigma-54 modulation protein